MIHLTQDLQAKRRNSFNMNRATPISMRFRSLLCFLANTPGRFSVACKETFDAIFGPNARSSRFFRRSCLASIISTLTCCALFVSSLGHEGFLQQFQRDLLPYKNQIEASGIPFSLTELILCMILIPCTLNLFADYLSLIKARYLMNFVDRTRSIARILLVMVLDQIGTYLALMVAFLGLVLPFFALGVLWSYGMAGFADLHSALIDSAGHLLHLIAAMNQPVLLIPCLASSFFTSIWLWLFSVPLILSTCANYVGNLVSRIGEISTSQRTL